MEDVPDDAPAPFTLVVPVCDVTVTEIAIEKIVDEVVVEIVVDAMVVSYSSLEIDFSIVVGFNMDDAVANEHAFTTSFLPFASLHPFNGMVSTLPPMLLLQNELAIKMI